MHYDCTLYSIHQAVDKCQKLSTIIGLLTSNNAMAYAHAEKIKRLFYL
jgi:hypothetical protein